MQEDSRLWALLHLVDDPDIEVYETVAQQLLAYGKEIIPELESLWENTIDESVQGRIEQLIHRAHFSELQQELAAWGRQPSPLLFHGALIVAKYRYPELKVAAMLKLLEQMKRNVWLELNFYLTPLEQINVLNSILYNYYKLQGHEIVERDPNFFFVNQTMENKHGNAFSIGTIYLALCEMLDIPIFAVAMPKQFVLAYFDSLHHFFKPDYDPVRTIQFYIDPVNGMVYTQMDVDAYLKKINEPSCASLFRPLTNQEVIIRMLEEMAIAYEYVRDNERSNEMLLLIKALRPGGDE